MIGDYVELLNAYPKLVVSVTELIHYLKANGLDKECQGSIVHLEEWMSVRDRVMKDLSDAVRLKKVQVKEQAKENTGAILFTEKYKKDLRILLDSLSTILTIKNSTLHEIIHATVKPLGIGVVAAKKYLVVSTNELTLLPNGLAFRILNTGMLM